jgi:two-component system, cell cycle response regulator
VEKFVKERPSVLVVGSEDRFQELEVLLPLARFEVSYATIEDALRTLHAVNPDLVVLDSAPSPLVALSFLQSLQRRERARPPVIFLSPVDDEQLHVRAVEAGADFLVHPIAPVVLEARMLRAVRDFSERKALAELAQTDALTGLANYRALTERLAQEFKRANRYGYPITAVMIDLDHLKWINDHHGHDAGNQAILAIANQLRGSLREVDFAARFGGDELMALLPYQTPDEGGVFAERLRAELAQVQLKTPGDSIPLTVSVGIAGHTDEDPRLSADELMLCADAALYEAKRQGRDRVVRYEHGLGDHGVTGTPHDER